jgi:hypothetical protein
MDEPGAGSRGGSLPPLTLDQARSLFEHWRRDEWGWLRTAIIRIAHQRGEFHADYIAEQQLSERNMIGAAVQALCKQGLLYSTGEHRRGGSSVSHGRRSYVYKLTQRGVTLGSALPAPPKGPEEDNYEQPELW